MNVSVKADRFGGSISAIPSKSYAHRMLICAALSKKTSRLECSSLSEDIEATADCLNSLGADIRYQNGIFDIHPINRDHLKDDAVIDCRESGSTLRFLLPVVCALGISCEIIMRGRLPERPLSPMYEELISHGIKMSPQGTQPFFVDGKLDNPSFTIAANVSSQFISGLLFALPLIGGGQIQLTGEIQSGSYIDITVECMKRAGISVSYMNQCFTVSGDYCAPSYSVVQGDWSNAAFWLCAGTISNAPITVSGLDMYSAQGDKKIVDVIKRFGGHVEHDTQEVTVFPSELKAIILDASDIPDLVPIVSVLAVHADGNTVIEHAERLRLKESDRIASVCQMLQRLGVSVEERNGGMIIYGQGKCSGGEIDSWNDHRIAMTAAVFSLLSDDMITIRSAECVRKSYPDFYKDFKSLGGTVEEIS